MTEYNIKRFPKELIIQYIKGDKKVGSLKLWQLEPIPTGNFTLKCLYEINKLKEKINEKQN